MKFPKADPQLAHLLEESLAGLEAHPRPMFGCPAWFAGSHMFAGVFGEYINLRLPPGPEQEEIMAAFPGAQVFEPFPGRRMKEYVSLPGRQARDGPAWRRWLRRSYDYALSLPPKPQKGK
ncbi:MAG: TfoX/Sxy family protein [Desulfarculus sp.]|nr:TfoX/Sxy family protein [Desulfarculus sp.]